MRYNFWVSQDALDHSPIKLEEAAKFFNEFYITLVDYDEYYGYSKPLIQFLNAYSYEIMQTAKILTFQKIIC